MQTIPEKLSQYSIKRLEQHLADSIISAKAIMRARLINWGKWNFINSGTIINQDTGLYNRSLLAVSMNFAPYQEKTGYYREASYPVDVEDAERINELIKISCSESEQRALVMFYAERIEAPTPTIRTQIRRAIDKMIKI